MHKPLVYLLFILILPWVASMLVGPFSLAYRSLVAFSYSKFHSNLAFFAQYTIYLLSLMH